MDRVQAAMLRQATTPEHPSEAAVADRLRLERSFYEFVRGAWGVIESAPFIDNWHIGMIAEHLQAVTAGEIKNIAVNIPPGCSKSTLLAVLWPAWEWANDPSVRFFHASYDQRLSTRDSVRCRALIGSDWYRSRWGHKFLLRGDQNLKTFFENDRGGYRLATSVGAHGLGQHPDRICIDDPHSVAGVESEAERQSALDWWDLTMSTRGVSRGVRRVIVMQRLADNDLSAHVLKEGGWVHVCLPMYFEAGRMKPTPLAADPLRSRWATDPRTREGELLTPRQFPEEAVAKIAQSLGSYGVAGQLQKRPAPKAGALFKRGWFKRYELANGDSIIRQGKPGVVPLASCSVFVIVDGAASSKATSDHSVIAVFAVMPDGDLAVLHVDRERLEVEDIVPRLQDVCLAWRPDWVGIESNGFQIWLVKTARDKARFPAIPTVRELDPEGKGKAARAAPAVIRAEQGQIYLPDAKDPRNPWVGGFEEECFAFTGKEGRPDDRVDCLCYAVLSIDRFSLGPAEDALPIAWGARGELPVYRDRRRGGIDEW
jgi:hypothetical protein